MDWDHTTDVAVIGYGGAGGMAAIAAHDAGADVTILEKAAEPGGTTRTSGGRMRMIRDPDAAVDYLYQVCGGTTPRDVIEVLVREGERIPELIAQLGGEVEVSADVEGVYPLHHDPQLPGVQSVDHTRWRVRQEEAPASGSQEIRGGANLFRLLARNVAQRDATVLLSTPARRLLVGDGGDVVGVEAERDGLPFRVKARRGVVMTCGGFAADAQMLEHYVGQGHYLHYCSPTNTGDGIRMAIDVGADLWHMSAIVAGFAYKVAEFPYPIPSRLSAPGYIYVDRDARRFMNETAVDSHLMWTQVEQWDVVTDTYPRVPAYQVFDHTTFLAGPVGVTARGRISEVYQWSPDNAAELERGWIVREDSLEALAEKVGLPGPSLADTVRSYNEACEQAHDPGFGRSPETLTPLTRPPYYAMQVWPAILNTQGGARRNAKAQVLDVRGDPIPRLYSAGEFGSLWHRLYLGAGNIKECLVFGRIAGSGAAAQPAWDGAARGSSRW